MTTKKGDGMRVKRRKQGKTTSQRVKNKKTLERCQGRRKLTRCTLGFLELGSSLLVGGGAISCKTRLRGLLVSLIGADALNVRAISMINCVNGSVETKNIGGIRTSWCKCSVIGLG
jgi:hypothetical protein